MGADVGDSSRGAERASAMWLPGSASGTLSAHAHMVLLFVALQRCTIDFMYFMAMQFYISFFGLAAVAALGEQTSDASMEHTAASEGVMPVHHPARTFMAQLRMEGVAHSVTAGVRRSTLGLCAAALRHHFCRGPTAVLMRADVKNKIYAAFASLAVRGPQRTEQLYERWVAKLAFKEYADELVVVAVALELSIRIVVIPYTPESALRPWAIPTYGSTSVAQNVRTTI